MQDPLLESGTKRVLWVDDNPKLPDGTSVEDDVSPKRLKASTGTSDGATPTCAPTPAAPVQDVYFRTPVNDANHDHQYSNDAVVVTPKRSEYLVWDDYFLAVALLSAKRSKDPDAPAGACIVDSHNRIVGLGYNGLPKGCSDELFPWHSSASSTDTTAAGDGPYAAQTRDWLHSKEAFVCDAVVNAILNKCSDNVGGCRIYLTSYPTSDASKVIIQSRIQHVVIHHTPENIQCGGPLDQFPNQVDSEDSQASRIMLELAGVEIRYHKPLIRDLTLDFVSKLTPTTVASDHNHDIAQEVPTSAASETATNEDIAHLLKSEANYDPSSIQDNGKRQDHISWEDYFMAMAFLTAERSKDPNTQVGACIVSPEHKILGLGYNGFPRGCSDNVLPWARSNKNSLHNKYVFVCHAEVNAILNKGSANVQGATIYVALFPCENCAKIIVQSGIRQVVYMSDSYHDTPGTRASRIILQAAGVRLRHYIPSMQKLVLKL